MRGSIFLAAITVLMFQHLAPAAQQEMTLSPARVSDFKPGTFLYASVDTTYAQVGQLIGSITSDMVSAMAAAGIMPSGAPLIVYDGATTDPTKTFTLKVGFPVADGSKAIGGYQIGDIGPKHCDVFMFMGTPSQLRQAYSRIFAKLAATGQQMSDERAERYLYYESQTSPNTVVMIEIGLQAPTQP